MPKFVSIRGKIFVCIRGSIRVNSWQKNIPHFSMRGKFRLDPCQRFFQFLKVFFLQFFLRMQEQLQQTLRHQNFADHSPPNFSFGFSFGFCVPDFRTAFLN